VCRGCGEVYDVHPSVANGLVETLERDHGFETDVQHLTVYGRCRDCRGS
jgi:Fur family transcriptional regulator, ferric uptake regulator